ncbi:MAG: class I SAM-dependent methyltransferase [Propylenella sp.]
MLKRTYRTVMPMLPATTQQRLVDLKERWGKRLPVPWVRFGSLRRQTPIGATPDSRGTAIDRYYIEDFMARNAGDIRGRVLECLNRSYTERFGGARVSRSDVLNVEAGNPLSTFVGDLAGANNLPSESFDCVILTQVLQLIYDLRTAIATVDRILKPGGVVLATMPGLTPVNVYQWPWMWMMTPNSARRLFQEYFPADAVTAESRGNVLAAISFLHGISLEELGHAALARNDPSYPVTVAIRAVKPDAVGT